MSLCWKFLKLVVSCRMWVCSLWLSWELLRHFEKKRKKEKRKRELRGVTGPRKISSLVEMPLSKNKYSISALGNAAPRSVPKKKKKSLRRWYFSQQKHPVPFPVHRLQLFLADHEKGLLWFADVCQLWHRHSIWGLGVSYAGTFWLLARCCGVALIPWDPYTDTV